MYYAADRRTAERVLVELRSIRACDQTAALAALQRLRNEVACERTSDLPRMQAWASIRRLYDACRRAPPQTPDLAAQWQDAIAKTAAWRESLR